MKRFLQLTLTLLAVAALLAVLVNLLAADAGGLPPVDPTMVITMPDGAERPLAGVVAASAESTNPRDLFELAEYERDRGRPDQALALFRSVPEGDRSYARAQRAIGWKLYTRDLGEPRRGVAFVNRSVAADPFDGNAWQDLVRVYAHGLGIPLH